MRGRNRVHEAPFGGGGRMHDVNSNL